MRNRILATGDYTVPGPWGPPGIDPGDPGGGYPEYGTPPQYNGTAPVVTPPQPKIPPVPVYPPQPVVIPPVSAGEPEPEPVPVVAPNGIVPIGPTVPTPLAPGQEYEATPVAWPIVAGAGLVLGRLVGRFSIGFLQLITRYGPIVVKGAIGVLAFNELLDLIGLGAPDETVIDVKGERKKKRYSIGHNPRVGTLAKVSRHCKRLLKRHEKVIREFIPKPSRLPARALAGTYLSTAEKRELRS
jgi:hypothetical protein